MKNIEDLIRDKLVENLKLIDPELELISKEYYLPKAKTTKGFIDILAKDRDNNYVIIEVKRSNQSAREAIHEIYKYTESLKEKNKVALGEIKSIIISTEWDELYIPFSTFANETDISITGFHLHVDKDYNILEVSKITPCKTSNGRVFSPVHECNLYTDKKNLKKGINSHIEIYKEKNIHDYVLIILKAPVFDKEKYKKDMEQMLADITGGDKSEFEGHFDKLEDYNFMIYSAFQRLTMDEYYKILERDKAQYDETKEYIDFEQLKDEDEILRVLENNVLGNIKPWFYSNHVEIGYPAKFANKILDEEKWEILEVIRSESLKNNLLLTDEKIISEIGGDTGIDNVIMYGSCETSHKAKFLELKKNSAKTLKYNVIWQNHVSHFLANIDDKKNYSIEINIYSPNHILLTLIKMVLENYENWLPHYSIAIKGDGVQNIYLGSFHWKRKKCKFSDIVKKYYNGEPADILIALTWGGFEEDNDKMLEDLGLTYESYHIERKNGIENIYLFRNYKFKKVKKIKNEIFDFISDSPEIIENLLQVYKRHHRQVKFTFEDDEE